MNPDRVQRVVTAVLVVMALIVAVWYVSVPRNCFRLDSDPIDHAIQQVQAQHDYGQACG
jgi:hypothetical protein